MVIGVYTADLVRGWATNTFVKEMFPKFCTHLKQTTYQNNECLVICCWTWCHAIFEREISYVNLCIYIIESLIINSITRNLLIQYSSTIQPVVFSKPTELQKMAPQLPSHLLCPHSRGKGVKLASRNTSNMDHESYPPRGEITTIACSNPIIHIVYRIHFLLNKNTKGKYTQKNTFLIFLVNLHGRWKLGHILSSTIMFTRNWFYLITNLLTIKYVLYNFIKSGKKAFIRLLSPFCCPYNFHTKKRHTHTPVTPVTATEPWSNTVLMPLLWPNKCTCGMAIRPNRERWEGISDTVGVFFGWTPKCVPFLYKHQKWWEIHGLMNWFTMICWWIWQDLPGNMMQC